MPSRDIGVSQAIDKFLFVAGLDVKPATVQYYEKSLRPLRNMKGSVDLVTTDDLRAVYASLHNRKSRYAMHPLRPALPGSLSIYTLHKYVRAWKRFFKWLVDEGMIRGSPAARLKRPKLPRAVPKDMLPDDLEKILKEARRTRPRDYAIVCFLADTACRVAGLAGLTMDRLDLREHRAIVLEKGDRARPVYFKDRTELAIMAYLEGERCAQAERLSRLDRPIENRVFLGEKGPLTPGGVYQILKRLAMRSHVQGRYNPHSLRHAWARQAIKRGASLKEIQQVLGHESITTTATFYAMFYDEEIAERHAALSWLPEE